MRSLTLPQMCWLWGPCGAPARRAPGTDEEEPDRLAPGEGWRGRAGSSLGDGRVLAGATAPSWSLPPTQLAGGRLTCASPDLTATIRPALVMP